MFRITLVVGVASALTPKEKFKKQSLAFLHHASFEAERLMMASPKRDEDLQAWCETDPDAKSDPLCRARKAIDDIRNEAMLMQKHFEGMLRATGDLPKKKVVDWKAKIPGYQKQVDKYKAQVQQAGTAATKARDEGNAAVALEEEGKLGEAQQKLEKYTAKLAQAVKKASEPQVTITKMSLPDADMTKLEMMRRTMQADLDAAKAVQESIEKAGQMDPELARELTRTITMGEKTSEHIKKLEGKGAKNLEVDNLKILDEEMTDVIYAADRVRNNVHPHFDKWWRFRYEYSFFESMLLVILIPLVGIFDSFQKWAHHELGHWSGKDDVFHQMHKPKSMYRSWVNALLGLLACLTMASLVIWLADRMGLYSWFAANIDGPEGWHFPSTAWDYRRQVRGVIMTLTVATLLYYALIFHVAQKCVEASVAWLGGETEEDRKGKRGSAFDLVVGGTSFALLSKYWNQVIPPDSEVFLKLKNVMTDGAGGAGWKLSDFPLAQYLALQARVVVKTLLILDTPTYVTLTLVYATCMLLIWKGAISYVQITCVTMILLTFFIMGLWYFAWRGTQRHFNKTDEGQPVSGRGQFKRSTTGAFESRPSLNAMADATSTYFHSSHFWMKVTQFTMFMMCYGMARLFVYAENWSLYPKMTGVTLAFFVLFFLFFWFYMSEVFPSFTAVISMPPYVSESELAMVADTMGPAAEKKRQSIYH